MRVGLAAAFVCVALGCSSSDKGDFPVERGPVPEPPVARPTFPEDGFVPPTAIIPERELLVTDAAIVDSARARNDRDGAPWSFRWLMEQLAPEGGASEMVLAWLDSWNGRRDAVASSIVCPWLKLTPSNACDDSCTQCNARALDLSRAPFKLLAIVNRLDLAELPRGCDETAAEARFVFVATSIGTAAPLPFNVILEYKVLGTRAGDARAWHALGARQGEELATDLATLTRSFSSRGATLGQLRTSENLAGESAGSAWELREFALRDGALVPSFVKNTPRDDLDGTPQLAAHINAKMMQIQSGDNAVEPSDATMFATMKRADFKWSAPDAPEFGLRLFGLSTCNGCHAGERGDTSVLPFAHIGVDARGATIVSRFLRDPAMPGRDELSFRARSLARRVKGNCGDPESSYGSRRGLGGEVPPRVPAPRVH